MNKNQIYIFYLYIFFSFVFIFTTTEYLTLEEIIYTANQTDAISYIEIAKYSPKLPIENDIIQKHFAQRFLIPYIIGFTSKIFWLDIFLTYKIFNYIFIFIKTCIC